MKALTTEKFIEKSNMIHNHKYDYTLCEYIKTNKKVIIICPLHGNFDQAPNDHLKGRGCSSCFGNKKLTTQEFIKKSIKIHGDKFSYNDVNYINNDIKIIIKCNVHGNFKQLPGAHLAGSGCAKCGSLKSYSKRVKSIMDFISQANKIHNEYYDYSKSNYTRAHCKIIIKCPRHGEFIQRASAHLSGQTCPKCSNNYISKIETKWLNSLGISLSNRQITLLINNKKYRVDAYDPITNTIYEFYGDYWHGNPNIFNLNDVNKHNKKSFKELFNDTILREEIYKKAGYKIFSIWETDYKKLINV